LLAWVLLAGLSLALHAALFDYRKHWFLARIRPSVSQTESIAEVNENIDRQTGRLGRLAMRLYLGYTWLQHSLTPDAEWRGGYLANAVEREAFLNDCRPFFGLVVWLGPTTHIAMILLATIGAEFFDDSFRWYLFAAIVPMNLMFVVALVWGRSLDARYPL
jgi:hypothetical protein